MKEFRHSRFEPHEQRPGEEARRSTQPSASVEGASAAYRQVGEEVTAVLTAAEQAAAQIRETARREAEQTKVAASEEAAATLADAEAGRRDADSYSGDTRSSADAYAEETRRRADETGAKRVAAAEEQARQIRVEAEQKASKLVADAVLRRDTLAESTKGLENRVDSMLTTLRDVASELEELLPAKQQPVASEPERRQTVAPETERPADETLEDALEPSRVKPG